MGRVLWDWMDASEHDCHQRCFGGRVREAGLRWSGTVNPRVGKYLLEEENQRGDECREDSQHNDNNSHSHNTNKQLLRLQEASMFHSQTGEELSSWIK